MSLVNLDPILDPLLQVAGIALAAAATWGVRRLATYLHVNAQSQAVANFDDALEKALTGAMMGADALIKQKGWDSVDVKNAVIAAALPTLIGKFPSALKGVGIDPADPAAIRGLATSALTRAFPAAVTKVSGSPATPPLPVAAPITNITVVPGIGAGAPLAPGLIDLSAPR